MSTAVLISGQMRTFARCYPSQRWQIFRHYEPDIHFFVSCAQDNNVGTTELIKENYANVALEAYKDPVLPKIPIEYGLHAPYANATSHDKLLLQHWGNFKVWEFFKSHWGQIAYDTVIRIRADIFIHRFVKPPKPGKTEAYCPWWGKFGGVNDRLAVMGMSAAESYFITYNRILGLLKKGCPFHPETLVAASMELDNIAIRNTLMVEFSTMRMDGQQRFPEILQSDYADLICSQTR